MISASIIIPTFNRADLISETIESCLNQTVKCQIIVCDHGSSDGTEEVLEGYRGQVKYVRKDVDRGPHFAWLDGLLNCDSDYIHFQFDDDLLDPTFMEKSLSLLKDDVGFVFSSALQFDDQGNEKILFEDVFDNTIVSSRHAEKFVFNKVLSPACVLLRKADALDALYQGKLPFQKKEYHGVGPDHFMTLLCLLRYKKIGYINQPLTKFRVHSGSITVDANQDEARSREIRAAYREVKHYYLQMKLRRYISLDWFLRRLPL